jgi:hypothetical protein
MVLRLAEALQVPLRERNALLLAAGYAPLYCHTGLDAPEVEGARRAVTPAGVFVKNPHLPELGESAAHCGEIAVLPPANENGASPKLGD